MNPSANGQAYRAYLENAQTLLNELSTADYYAAPLPAPTDDALAEIVSAFTAWPAPVRERFLANLPDDRRGIFAIFGHRAATLALRREDAELLRLGLVGNVIANTPIPPNRNVDTALAVFYHCAQKLELETAELFDEAARFADAEMAAALKTFGRRAGVTLNQFGWRVIRTEEGVRYKFEW